MNLKGGLQRGLDLWDSLWCPKDTLGLECILDRLDHHSLIPQRALNISSEGLGAVTVGRVVGYKDHRQRDLLVSRVNITRSII